MVSVGCITKKSTQGDDSQNLDQRFSHNWQADSPKNLLSPKQCLFFTLYLATRKVCISLIIFSEFLKLVVSLVSNHFLPRGNVLK